MNWMNWAEWYNRVLDFLVGGILLVIVTLVLVQVGARYIFGGAYTWSEEGNLFLWGWMILFAAIRADHMRVDFLVKHLPKTARKVVIILIGLISIFLLGILFWGGIQMVKLTQNDYYIALNWLSVKWLFVALMISTALWAVKIVSDTVLAFRAQASEEA
jgi:TRAP-type C4-dicarboxylate transport system permease small subunit